jgi:uncharacterized membrane protein
MLRILRIVLLVLVQALLVYLFSMLIPGFTLSSILAALFLLVLVSIVYAVLWPLLVRFAVRFSLAVFVVLMILFSGYVVYWASLFSDQIIIAGPLMGILVALVISLVLVITGTLFDRDDSDRYIRFIRRTVRARYGEPKPSEVPGVMMLEIDGLAEDILHQALEGGHLPTLKRWLDSGSHQVFGWECDWSSQTSASQAGILHGDNADIPAFRWYEKGSDRVMVSNHPRDTKAMQGRISNADGLLVHSGVGRGNMFTGDAHSTMFTVSAILEASRNVSEDYYPYFAYPFNLPRMLVLSLWDIVLELYYAWQQRRQDIQPRGHRGGYYPFVRAFTTVFTRELAIYTLISDMLKGVPSAYVTFVGYDEVAHHSGLLAPDAMRVLQALDQQFALLERAVRYAPRPYHFVVLSDHGQTQGATFRQRYGQTLAELASQLAGIHAAAGETMMTDEGLGQLNVFLSDVITHEGTLSKGVRRVLEQRTDDAGYVRVLEDEGGTQTLDDMLVMASGNLGLIYFTRWDHRLTLEEISTAYPALISGLVAHEGIGFVMVRSAADGALAIGRDGVYFLDSDRFEGENPLAKYGDNAPLHLRRTDGFSNVADIMVNSFYNPDTHEVAAFEELISCHGGLGGFQSHPFLMVPTALHAHPLTEPIIGAENVYRMIKGWLNPLHGQEPVYVDILNAVSFDSLAAAQAARSWLKTQMKARKIGFKDIAIGERRNGDNVRLHQTRDITPEWGALGGGILGLLLGLVFGEPLLGLITGALVAALLVGARDSGINNRFMKTHTRETIDYPATLFFQVSPHAHQMMQDVLEQLMAQGGQLTYTTNPIELKLAGKQVQAKVA